MAATISSRQPPMGRGDALAKALGRVAYAADRYEGPGLLWAGAKRAGVAHARLRGLDLAAARATEGVAAVLTHRDVTGSNRQGVVRRDQPVLVEDLVRHAGDALALVVAESPAVLRRALALIRADLEPLPTISDPAQALAPGAPVLHADHPTGNLLLAGELREGQGAAALAACPAVAEATLHLPRQEHAYLETETGWARLGADGRLEMVVSTQTPFRDRAELADALGLPPERIRIVAPCLGGAFGGKDGITVQCLLGLAALALPGRPVRMTLSREESFLASAKRHPARVSCRLGADAKGELQAVAARAVYDTGAYDHLGGAVMTLGLEHLGGPYRIPHAELRAEAVYTNNPLGGAMRGFGVPQAAAGVEIALDILARRLGEDPLAYRLRHAVARGERTPAGVVLTNSIGLKECLTHLASHPLWRGREAWKAAAGPWRRRGVGVAAGFHALGYGPVIPDEANAKLELAEDGRLRLYCGVVEMGQGNSHAYRLLAAQALNQDPAGLELILPDTDRTLPSGSASASRTVFTFGRALLAAAKELEARLRAAAATAWDLAAEDTGIELLPGALHHPASGRRLSLAELAARLPAGERTATARHRAPVSEQLAGIDPALRLQGLPHCLFSFGAHLAAVEVDELTGGVRVDRYLVACDCGQVLDRQGIEQQMEGSVAMGLGYALWEDFASRDGLPLARDFSTYLLPTALDLPEVECHFVETYEEHGPLGMKGSGEVAMDTVLPAVANAVADACGGARIYEFPLTRPRVLAALAAGADVP